MTGDYICPAILGSLAFAATAYHLRVVTSLDKDHAALALSNSRQKILQSQVRQAQKMESVGHLVGGVAHDFNNLLTVINGYTELIRAGASDQQTRRQLDKMSEAIDRGADISARLLVFSRTDDNEHVAGDVPLALERSHELLSRLLEPSLDLNLVCSLPDGATVPLGTNSLEQVLTNLVMNSADAIAESNNGSGQIAMTAEATTTGSVRIQISDNGTGMADTCVEKCTEAFFTTKAPGDGTGLGLSVVQSLVSQARGTMHIKSKVGVGTTVTIKLPMLTQAKPNTHHVIDLATPPPAIPRTVLVYDEDPLVLEVINAVLEDAGYLTMTAASGPAVKVCLRDNSAKIDLVIANLHLPTISGISLGRYIETNYASVAILSVSGYAQDSDNAEFDSAGVPLNKPFTNEELLTAVSCSLGDSVRSG